MVHFDFLVTKSYSGDYVFSMPLPGGKILSHMQHYRKVKTLAHIIEANLPETCTSFSILTKQDGAIESNFLNSHYKKPTYNSNFGKMLTFDEMNTLAKLMHKLLKNRPSYQSKPFFPQTLLHR